MLPQFQPPCLPESGQEAAYQVADASEGPLHSKAARGAYCFCLLKATPGGYFVGHPKKYGKPHLLSDGKAGPGVKSAGYESFRPPMGPIPVPRENP